MDLTGIENEAEFFPAGTLSDVLEVELQDITNRWSKDLEGTNPVARLTSAAEAYTRVYRQLLNTSDKSVRAELYAELTSRAANALGYDVKRGSETLALDAGSLARVLNKTFDADGKPALWILETPTPATGEEQSDPLSQTFDKEQFAADEADYAETDLAVEELLAEGIFDLADAPRYVLVAGASQWVLVDQRKWPARSVLRFDLQEIFSRQDRDTYRVMGCLVAREARVPVTGVPISDRLEEEAQRNANLVTTSLKKTVRDAIELLGQEVLDVTEGKFPSGPKRGVWIDGPTLSLECLRYMYRLLFLLYAESNPRLKILDLKDPLYASGYSMEALRDLESVRLRTPQEKKGTYLWESLQQVLALLYSGENHVLKLPTVKVSLLDPERTPLLNSVKLRNEAVQKVIRLLSLRSSSNGMGRISYSKLGIGQLGSVYETLISFTGVVAKSDLIELKPRRGRSVATDDEETDETSEVDDEAEEDVTETDDHDHEDEMLRRDKVDPLAPSWFVPRNRIGEFAPEEIVFNGPEARIYPKGSFIYRLAGRDREKSASYYTPEPLARLLVKHALMERCKDLTADDLLELKVLEPAMGSAAFLVETTNQLADLYLERKQKETGKTISQDQVVIEKQKIRAFIADRNCFGVDLNPIAVELGAISLWLNSLHGSDFSPWFGDQLHAGNSLIGARRASYPANLLTARKQADLWLKAKPDEIGWRKRLPDNHVWQWLLPARDMASFDKDKSIKPFAGDAQERIKKWRKGGFFKKLEPHEVKLVQKLSRVAETLFDQVAKDLAKTREAANDEITLWPGTVMSGNKGLDFHGKEHLAARLTGVDHAANTLPYKRLKTAMDAWCALWFWPLDKADLLPSRAEFLLGMAMILEGGFTPDGSLAAPSVDEFADPVPDFLDQLEPCAPARDLFKAAAKRQEGLFRETNVEALVEIFDWLQVAVDVAERVRFVHFDLIFADVMKTRGGFDLVIGNPPWAKLEWKDTNTLADVDPALSVKNMTAKQAKEVKLRLLASAKNRSTYLAGYVELKGQLSFFATEANWPNTGSGAKNLYRLFFDISLKSAAKAGIAALIHQDGHLSTTTSNGMRAEWYKHVIKHFEFSNQLRDKNFLEILNTKRFSLNIYSGEERDIEFTQFTNAFLAHQVDESFLHDGTGICTGIKEKGTWVTAGHKKRLFQVSASYLQATGKLAGLEDEKFVDAPLFQVLNEDQALTLEIMGRTKGLRSTDIELQSSSFANQSDAEAEGAIQRQTHWPNATGPFFVSGPSLYPLNPLAKTPRRLCSTPKHYDAIDLSNIGSSYRPRSNFLLADNIYLRDGFNVRCQWNQTAAFSSEFRFVFRRRIDVGTERSLCGAIMPPDALHAHQLTSIAFREETKLLNAAALWSSLLYDFAVKAMRQGDVYPSTLLSLPYVDLPNHALIRVLQLNCVTEDYSGLWKRNSEIVAAIPSPWQNLSAELELELDPNRPADWRPDCALRSPLARRLAMIEIDVLIAQELGFELDNLLNLLTAFPVLLQNEAETFYDRRGKIVWTTASGFQQTGYLEDGRRPDRKKWDEILEQAPSDLVCKAIDDTMSRGPIEVTRHFFGPFTRVDRIEDYRQAWVHFENLKQEGSL